MPSDLSAPCLRCGVPAPEHGEHHHNPSEFGPVGKGSGGQGAKVAEHPRVVLCRACHNSVHLGEWVLKLDGDIAKGFEGDIQVFERGIEVRDDQSDCRFWSDEQLANYWRSGEDTALKGLAIQCSVAAEFYARYKGQPEWYVRVAQIISDFNGYSVHWRDVYRRVKLYEAFGSDWDTYLRLGKTLALAVAESREPEKALEIANTRKDEGGHTSTEIIREIRGQEPPEPRKCPHCGGTL